MTNKITIKEITNRVNNNNVVEINKLDMYSKYVTIEGKIIEYNLNWNSNYMIDVLKIEDKTGKISAVILGLKKDAALNRIIDLLSLNDNYRISGEYLKITDVIKKDIEELFENKFDINYYVKQSKIFIINSVEKI